MRKKVMREIEKKESNDIKYKEKDSDERCVKSEKVMRQKVITRNKRCLSVCFVFLCFQKTLKSIFGFFFLNFLSSLTLFLKIVL